jgi:hypothetical protein
VLRKATIYNIITKLSSMGSVLYKRSLKKDVLTEEKLDDIGARLEASLKKLLHPLTLQCELAECTANIGNKVSKVMALQTTVRQKDCSNSDLRSSCTNVAMKVVEHRGVQTWGTRQGKDGPWNKASILGKGLGSNAPPPPPR